MRKNSNLTFWMIVLGSLAAWMSLEDMRQHWSYLVTRARIVDALVLASGLFLLTAGAWRGSSRSPSPAACWLGAASAALFAVTMIAGLLSGAIPCSGVG